MKHSTKKFSTLFKTLIAGVVVASTITACSDKNDCCVLPESNLLVAQASYDAIDLDLFVNKEKVNKEEFKFTNTTDYLNILAGKNSITIKEAGKEDTIKTKEIDFNAGKSYSLFIGNKMKNVEYVLIEDDLTAPKEGDAKVRFVNMSPETTGLDIKVKDAEKNLFEKAEFKAASKFTELKPETYTFEIKEAGSENILFSLEDVKIEKGKIYTIWTKGIIGGADVSAFGAQVITNK